MDVGRIFEKNYINWGPMIENININKTFGISL